MKVNDLLVLM